jgi:Mg2+/Co2+ transporter CorC
MTATPATPRGPRRPNEQVRPQSFQPSHKHSAARDRAAFLKKGKTSMKDIQVKQVMIPISDYVTVKKEDHLTEVLAAIEKVHLSKGQRAHRDAVVVDETGTFCGKVTMIDIFRALEPNYPKVQRSRQEQTLTADFVRNAVKELKLWMEPLEDVCARGRRVTVADAMHAPEPSEYLQITDTLEKALSLYVMGVHQPLIVKDGDTVVGLLRFGDLFEVVREHLLKCDLQ